MDKRIVNLANALKENTNGEWSVLSIDNTNFDIDVKDIAMEQIVHLADSQQFHIFETDNYDKSNYQLYEEGADFDFDYQMLLDEYKDGVYDDVANAIKSLGGEVIYSSTDVDDFTRECRLRQISDEDIQSFGTLKRFDMVYRIAC